MTRRLRVAVIGAGWYAAENHIPALTRRPEIVLDGVCRLGTEELERVRSHFGFAFASQDYRDVLARKPQAVIVASPHALHYVHARDALEAGAHVLCEKPMTLDPAEAWDLAARAERLGRHLLVANGFNYLPRLDTVRRWLLNGEIGAIEQVNCQFTSATRAVFSGDVGFQRWQNSFFRPARSTWQDPQGGGGFAYGQLSHSAALMFWITGLSAVEVSARSFPHEGIDLHDAAVIGFDNGAIGSLFGGAGVPEGGRARLRLSVAGTKGIVDLDVDLDRCEMHRDDGTVRRLRLNPREWAYSCLGPVDALADLALGRGTNRSPAEVAAKTVELIAALRRSAQSAGEKLRIERPSC
jgi:predicted dehydrogenase